MAKRSTKTTAKKSTKNGASRDPKAWEKGLTPCQLASRLTWKLKGELKRLQKSYLRVAEQLVRVRDERLWAEMINPKHPDIEDYAQKRLGLKKTSLYRYLLAYDWVSKNHPAWLKTGFTGTIPDMADVIDLIWIDKELKKEDLAEKKKEALADLKDKAEAGDLKKGELGKLLRQRNRSQADYAKSILTELRSLRKRAAQRSALPSEAMTQFDVLIGLVAKSVEVSSIDFGHPGAFA